MTTTPLTPLMELQADALRCPHQYFDQVRNESRAWWSEELGAFVVTGYDDIVEVLRNPTLFSSASPTAPPKVLETLMAPMMEAAGSDPAVAQRLAASAAAPRVLLTADPPTHGQQRRLVNRAFGPARVKSMEAKIREIADELIDGFIDIGRVELVNQFAVGLPLTVIADALGVERQRMGDFKRWSDDFVAPAGNSQLKAEHFAAMARSQIEFDAYFAEKIAQRRREPRDDLITDVVHAEIDGVELTVEEMLSMFGQFLIAGNETTTKLITSGMLLLLRHPDVMEAVRADHATIPGVVEEALRLEGPVRGLFRLALADAEVGGVPIPAGSNVWLVYTAANRDPRQFPDPETFDPRRDNASLHLAFSQGPHYCLGAALARSEGVIAFERLLSRLDDIAIDETRTRFEYEPSWLVHGLKELHLTFGPRR